MKSAFKLTRETVRDQTEVYTSAWTVTHDQKNFPEPNTFKPERWLDADGADVKDASQPFSLGPRGCLGRKLAIPLHLSLSVYPPFLRSRRPAY
jgi:cytochrome P450